MVYGSWDQQQSIFKRLAKSIKQFFDKLITTVKNFFSSKVDDNVKELDKLPKNEKILVKTEDAKIISECDKTLKELEHTKTTKDVDKVMSKHRHNKAKIGLCAAVTAISVGTAAAYLKHAKQKDLARLDSDRRVYIDLANLYYDSSLRERKVNPSLPYMNKTPNGVIRGKELWAMYNKDAADEIAAQMNNYGYSDVIKARMEVISNKTNATLHNISEMLSSLKSLVKGENSNDLMSDPI